MVPKRNYKHNLRFVSITLMALLAMKPIYSKTKKKRLILSCAPIRFVYYALSSYGQSELLGEISRMRKRNYEMAYTALLWQKEASHIPSKFELLMF